MSDNTMCEKTLSENITPENITTTAGAEKIRKTRRITTSTGRIMRRGLTSKLARIVRDDSGMSTVEYAIGTVAAAAFGALLYTVVTGGDITAALTDIIDRALNTQ